MFKVRSGSLKFSAGKHNLRGGEAKARSYAICRKFIFVSIHQQDGSTVYQWSRHIFQGQLTFSCQKRQNANLSLSFRTFFSF